jgi:dTDP-4-amino-4,6-dideoxygalactose transaminase
MGRMSPRDDAAGARPIPLAKPCFGREEEEALVEALRSGWVSQGPRVAEFEERFAAAVDAPEAVAMSSGTTALFLSLLALGIGPGDEVVVPSLSFIATANAVAHCGASPVFADVDPRTYNLDPACVEAALGPRTRAILVVHQLGLPADLDAIEAVARPRGLAVVEDAACALGSRLHGRPVGSSGRLCCFSFHPRKVLVTGEGGMITTGDRAVAERLRRLRHQGMSVSDLERHRAARVITEEYPEVGYNFRLSDLHAALGLAQLPKLPRFLARRRALAARYDEALASLEGVVTPFVPAGCEPNYQSYIVQLAGTERDRRDRLLGAMLRRGIATRRGLMAAHRERAHAGARIAGALPCTEAAEAQTLVLPIFPDLSDEDQERTLRAFGESLAEVRA